MIRYLPMRVNIFIENYLPGGLERFYSDLIDGLPADEFEVTLLVNPINGLTQRLQTVIHRPINLALYRPLTSTRLDYGLLKANEHHRRNPLGLALKAISRPPLSVLSGWSVHHLLQRHPADVLHVFNGGYPGAQGCLKAISVGRVLHFPCIILSILSYPYPRRNAFDARLDREVSQSVDVVSPNSAAAGQGMIELRGFPTDRIRPIASGTPPPPVDLNAGQRLRAELGLPANSLIVGTVAALEPLKGHLVLLEAIDQIQHEFPQVYFVFSGEGVMRPQLEDFIRRRQLNNRVYLLGFTKDARAITNAFDAVAFPSFSEGMPIAILEAMALGKPIVATQVGGIPEEIEHGVSGWLVPPRDSAALASALRQLLGSFEQARAMGAAARDRYYRLFTVQHMVNDYIKLYTSHERPTH
jgi:glycosyltransferase involved in cell wall biosynthesis